MASDQSEVIATADVEAGGVQNRVAALIDDAVNTIGQSPATGKAYTYGLAHCALAFIIFMGGDWMLSEAEAGVRYGAWPILCAAPKTIGMVITLLGGDEVGNWRGELFGHPWPERKILPKVRKGYNYIWKVSPPKHPLLTV